MNNDVMREELLSELDRLAHEEDALRARRSITTYRLEQVLRERERLRRHLNAVSIESTEDLAEATQEGAA